MNNDYQATDKMISLISDNYQLLQVMSRFGISLGFGDKTVAEVCKINQVDTTTFLAVINFAHTGYSQIIENIDDLSIPSLINYLKQSHIYFLEFQLPKIRKELDIALDHDNHITPLIIELFDHYIISIKKHMNYEDKHLFSYVEKLLHGNIQDNIQEDFEITTFSKNHYLVDDNMHEIKNTLIKYNPAKNNNELSAVLYNIYCFENELDAHCKAEDYIFLPAVFNLEKKIQNERK